MNEIYRVFEEYRIDPLKNRTAAHNALIEAIENHAVSVFTKREDVRRLISLEDLIGEIWVRVLEPTAISVIVDRELSQLSDKTAGLNNGQMGEIIKNQIRDVVSRLVRKKSARNPASSLEEGRAQKIDSRLLSDQHICNAAESAWIALCCEITQIGIPMPTFKMWIIVVLSKPEKDKQAGKPINRFKDAAKISWPKAASYHSRILPIVKNEVDQFRVNNQRNASDDCAFIAALVQKAQEVS